MKKQYINPEITVVVLNIQNQLMAGSITETLKTTEVYDDVENDDVADIGFVQF